MNTVHVAVDDHANVLHDCAKALPYTTDNMFLNEMCSQPVGTFNRKRFRCYNVGVRALLYVYNMRTIDIRWPKVSTQ